MLRVIKPAAPAKPPEELSMTPVLQIEFPTGKKLRLTPDMLFSLLNLEGTIKFTYDASRGALHISKLADTEVAPEQTKHLYESYSGLKERIVFKDNVSEQDDDKEN